MYALFRTMVLTVFFAAPLVSAPAYYLSSTPKRVFFVGNSYTNGQGGLQTHVPGMARAAASPDTMSAVIRNDGGKPLSVHWNSGIAQDSIRQGNWDVVVLQEYILHMSMADFDTFYHYARLFDNLIDSVGAQTVLFLTQPNSLFDLGPLQQAIDSAAVLLDAVVAPAGLVYPLVIAERPDLYLYLADGNHAGPPGVYLNTCVFYTTFTRKCPVGIPYMPYSTLNAEEYAYLQGAAWDVMRDYLEPACASPDTPSVPTGVAGQPLSESSIRLTWNASTLPSCGVNKYRVFRNSVFVGATYQSLFTDQGLLGGTTYSYTVSAVGLNNVASAQSAPCLATSVTDSVPPQLLEARPTRRINRVELVFSEALDTASAQTPANYAVDHGVTVSAAKIQGNGRDVALTLSVLAENVTYTVTVSGVKDNSRYKNTILPGAQKTFVYVPLTFMTSCIGYWPFDNTLEDYSARGRNGAWVGTGSYAAGHSGACIDLVTGDTARPYVTIPFDSTQGGMARLTVSVWFKKAHPDSGGELVSKWNSYRIMMDNDRIWGEISTSSGTRVWFDQTTALINNTDWHHLVITYDGSFTREYVDAVRIFSVAQTGTVTSSTYGLRVGKVEYGTARTFYGKFDELRLYTAALDSATVAALYSDDPYAAGAADSVAVRWLLDQNMLGNSLAEVTRRDVATNRVLGLYLDSLDMYRLTEHIGQLTALRSLRCAGDTLLDTSLAYIDPAIGGCTALETLMLGNNKLTTLPDQIVNLTKIKVLDVGHNQLCNLSTAVKTWLDTYDPDWALTQTGCATTVLQAGPAVPHGPFTLYQQGRRVTIRYAGSAPTVAARIWQLDGTRLLRADLSHESAVWESPAAGVYIVELSAGKTTQWLKLLVW